MARGVDDITVAIAAAGRVSHGTLTLGRASSPAMIPVAGRPVAHWTVSYLASLGLRRFVLAVPEHEPVFEEFMAQAFGDRAELEFFVPERDGGLGGTVAELAQRVETSSTLVVLGDTHFEFADAGILLSDEPVVLTSPVAESFRWCIAEIDPSGRVAALRDKVPDLAGPLEALIGVYLFPRTDDLRRAANAALDPEGGRTEMAAILGQLAAGSPIRAERGGTWLDCGNPDRQGAAQRMLLQQRTFNDIVVDDTFGTITKRSRNAEKFIDEINYVHLLPNDLEVLFPRVLDESTRWDDPWVTMEFYGYPTLAELYLFEQIDPGMWRGVFEHLRAVIERGFMTHRRPLPGGAVRTMYLDKLVQRLDGMDDDHPVSRLASLDRLVLNGMETTGLSKLLPRLEDEVDRLTATTVGAVVHGDLCFSNILYDLRSRVLKLIDPRGSFGVPGVFGDPRYDVAKLHHSAVGGYDLITADLFALQVDRDHADLEIHAHDLHRQIGDVFSDVFESLFGRRDVELVSGLIFLGLPALHPESTDRQVAFFLRGLQLVNGALEATT